MDNWQKTSEAMILFPECNINNQKPGKIDFADILCIFNTLRQGNWQSSMKRYKKYMM